MHDDEAMLLALVLILTAAPRNDARLVGNWNMEGRPFLTLNADGTGTMVGDALKWRTDGATLLLLDEDGETDRVPFRVEGDTLTLNVSGVNMSLTRAGKAAKVGKTPAATEQPARNDELSRLLLSSNWCWLRYANGNSYTQKVHFAPNGTWQDFSESDIYVSNPNVVAQATGNRSGGGQWQVKNGQLWLSSPDSPQLQPVQLSVTRNSNGYPIINADGREYSMCN
ncbi:MAG: hypothetical protein DI536_19680 [Archangium gephyra]|uniref:Uncharacterized protein n=1 Tax=Archangium gephyra TaxID=48 RepID=A0A2W5T995_9BACT|nr:MAG: hypothetical protein DI536_19680 [Archangium gephyra]